MPALAVPAPAPMLVTPAPYEVSFGRIAGRVSPEARMLLVSVDGRVVAKRDLVRRSTFDFHVELPQRDLRLTVTAVYGSGRRRATSVGPIVGLPRSAEPRGPPRRSVEDAQLAREIRALAARFPGTCAIFVQDLRTGAGAAWNARAEFPAASTLKVGIAIEILRALRGRPPAGSRLDRLLRKAIVPSDDKAANDLLIWLGGSTSGGSARVNATFRALGLTDTEMYGGYIVPSGRIPLRADSQPRFVGKRTSAWDFARLLRFLHQAAEGSGKLARLGGVVPGEAKYLLYLLAHSRPGYLERDLGGTGVTVLNKPGWITRARHDGGLAFWRGGSFVAVVLTYSARGVGVSSEVLAGRVALAAFARFSRGRAVASYAGSVARRPSVRERERILDRIRELCLSLPESSERLSHGHPTFFVRGKRSFAMVLDDHHGDGRFALWCAAEDGMQQMLTEADPARFFRPPYVGHRGWLGVRLDRGLFWDELAGLLEDAYAEVAPAKLVEDARRRQA
ncbi:MAG TPA: serine hydrolase [Gaiellaceae bacterium]|nr:serine hydrolase [Gaiellaceae bacterium]